MLIVILGTSAVGDGDVNSILQLYGRSIKTSMIGGRYQECWVNKKIFFNSVHRGRHGTHSKRPLPRRRACAVAQRGYLDIYLFCYVLDCLVAVDHDMQHCS